ncbi:hypothetical protein CVT26_010735 [Gymnopilus dilepis]|uniref:Uncharacterized protein n=1 Tax=Gymnopilus dilepis TaxID=231916 RepID=A0A409Y0Q5_9AGAR|nr:hypothetical protein CVT26_010735 [Gymnopilus dilepis]
MKPPLEAVIDDIDTGVDEYCDVDPLPAVSIKKGTRRPSQIQDLVIVGLSLLHTQPSASSAAAATVTTPSSSTSSPMRPSVLRAYALVNRCLSLHESSHRHLSSSQIAIPSTLETLSVLRPSASAAASVISFGVDIVVAQDQVPVLHWGVLNYRRGWPAVNVRESTRRPSQDEVIALSFSSLSLSSAPMAPHHSLFQSCHRHFYHHRALALAPLYLPSRDCILLAPSSFLLVLHCCRRCDHPFSAISSCFSPQLAKDHQWMVDGGTLDSAVSGD